LFLILRFVEPDQDIESLTANDSAKLAFDRLVEKYDQKFMNKYTRWRGMLFVLRSRHKTMFIRQLISFSV